MEKTEEMRSLSQTKEALKAGDSERVAQQHAAGKGTARERLAQLFDAGSFMEIDALRKDSNVVAGYGTVHGRAVYCFAQDYASCGGAMTRVQAEKIVKLLNMAQLTGAPVVALLDSAGVKVTEGAASLPAYADIFSHMTRLSGVCPMIACVMGECRGVATMFTQVCDISVQTAKNGFVALHSLNVMNTEKGRSKTQEQMFGADEMAAQGAVSLTAKNEEEAISLTVTLLDALPGCNVEDAPLMESDDLNRTLIACDAENALSLVSEIADNGLYTELGKAYGKAAHTVLTHVGGRSVGLVATDHAVDGGRLDAAACGKIARFVRLCDCYQMPVVTLVNTEGVAVPEQGQQAWTMRSVSQMLYAYAEATTPKLAVITGSAIGAAYVAMGGKAIADAAYAWENAMIAPLTAEVAVAAFDDDKLTAGESRDALENEYRESTGAKFAAENGLVDDVIDPRDTRKMLIAAMEFLSSKRDVNPPKKHGNMPL